MKKIILHEIGNQDNFNYYVFDKKSSVAENLSTIFSKIFKINWNFDAPDKKGNYRKFNVNKWTDIHEKIDDGDNSKIDVFYGNKKMYITIICSQKLRLKFNEELGKISVMPKSVKIKKIK